MPPSVERRLVILAEGNFGFHHGKTAMGMIRFGHDKVVAVSTRPRPATTSGSGSAIPAATTSRSSAR